MGRLNKRQRQLQILREAKQRKLEEKSQNTLLNAIGLNDSLVDELHEAHWEGLSESESDSDDVEISDPEENIPNEDTDAFEILMRTAQDSVKETKFLYQRGSVLSERQQFRRNAAERERANAASAHSQPISRFFSSHTTRNRMFLLVT
ncbi:hypothetical protein V8E54_005815 [Elaphomyces granulatus]